MKVLQINSVCGYGSTGRITTDLYDVLENEGHECCIAYGRGSAPKKYRTIKIGNRLDVIKHVLLTRFFDLQGFGSRSATKKLLKEIEEYKPDIIHLHNVHGYYINIDLLFSFLKKSKIPVVWLFHDQWAFSPHAANFHVEENESLPEKNQYKKQNLEYPKSFVDFSNRNYHRKKDIFTKIDNLQIVTPSKWLKNMAEKTFFNGNKISVINNGIDLETFKPRDSDIKKKYNLTNKKIILGVASVWTKTKGLDYFNRLVNDLDDEYQIVLVGIKNSKLVNENIVAISRTNNRKELSELYSLADVFVNPTLQDTFPTTNLEALACGTPVITFDTGGSPESVVASCGTVVERGNYTELLNAVKHLLQYPKDHFYNNCIKQSKKYNKSTQYMRYLKIYHELLK